MTIDSSAAHRGQSPRDLLSSTRRTRAGYLERVRVRVRVVVQPVEPSNGECSHVHFVVIVKSPTVVVVLEEIGTWTLKADNAIIPARTRATTTTATLTKRLSMISLTAVDGSGHGLGRPATEIGSLPAQLKTGSWGS